MEHFALVFVFGSDIQEMSPCLGTLGIFSAPRGTRTRTGHRQINHRVNATQTDMTGPTYQPVKWKGGKWKGNQPDAHATAGSPK